MEVKELSIQNDDEFIKQINGRRELIEKITITVALVFFFNAIVTFLILNRMFERESEYGTWSFASIYIENVLVVGAILFIFNKYKF